MVEVTFEQNQIDESLQATVAAEKSRPTQTVSSNVVRPVVRTFVNSDSAH